MIEKNVKEAIKLASEIRVDNKVLAAVNKKRKDTIRKAKEKACVHFMTDVPNDLEGWALINLMKKYLHRGRYSLRLKGRGSRKEHGDQRGIPIKYAERYSIYIDQKIKDSNHPEFLHSKMWKMRSKLHNLRSEIDELLK